MPKRLVNREELGKIIVQTSGAISMITESNYIVRSTSGNNTYTVTATNPGRFVHVQIMRTTMPSASMQLNSIEAQLFNPLSQAPSAICPAN